MSDRSSLYAEAMYTLIEAEGGSNEVQDELFRFSRILESNDELRQTLQDPHLPVDRRVRIVEDLLGCRATGLTTSLVSMVVFNGRVRELASMVSHLLDLCAARGEKVVAEVRSAVELTDDQKARLAAALKQKTGKDVDIVVVLDPSVIGGIVTQIGDTVIDGSVRQRLSQLRESF
jgi:F-type H+-transporting ATPase subunit delta